jgi:hypothetical protein
MIAISELERAPQDADGVVVRLFAPISPVGDLDERGVSNIEESHLA